MEKNNERKPISNLQVKVDFSTEEKISDLISKFTVKILYLGKNRNHSYFTEEVVKDMVSTLGGVPVVGHYDAEKADFLGHGDLDVTIDDNGEVQTRRVGPVPYGFTPLQPKTWFQEEEVDGETKKYLCSEIYLWTGRYPELLSLKDGDNNQSMELNPEHTIGEWTDIEGEPYYVITKTSFAGLCILGKDVEPCFEGAKINFSLGEDFTSQLAKMKQELYSVLEASEELQEETSEEPAIEGNEEPEQLAEESEVVTEGEDGDEEPTSEELESIEKETTSEDPENFDDIDSSIDDVEKSEQYEEILSELRNLKDNYEKVVNDYAELKTKYDILKKEKEEYVLEQERIMKREVIAKYQEYLSEDKVKEFEDNLDNYTEKDIETQAVMIAFQNMKKDFALFNNKEKKSQDYNFSLAENEEENLSDEDKVWKTAVLRNQKTN